jgi:hypothetical protein
VADTISMLDRRSDSTGHQGGFHAGENAAAAVAQPAGNATNVNEQLDDLPF